MVKVLGSAGLLLTYLCLQLGSWGEDEPSQHALGEYQPIIDRISTCQAQYKQLDRIARLRHQSASLADTTAFMLLGMMEGSTNTRVIEATTAFTTQATTTLAKHEACRAAINTRDVTTELGSTTTLCAEADRLLGDTMTAQRELIAMMDRSVMAKVDGFVESSKINDESWAKLGQWTIAAELEGLVGCGGRIGRSDDAETLWGETGSGSGSGS